MDKSLSCSKYLAWFAVALLCVAAAVFTFNSVVGVPTCSPETVPVEVKELYLDLLEMSITGSLVNQKYGNTRDDMIETKRMSGQDWPGELGFTLIGHKRLRQFRKAIEKVISQNIPGDIGEFGVWRGGACIYAAGLLKAMNEFSRRRVVLFDAFETLPNSFYAANHAYLKVPEEKVRQHFVKFGFKLDTGVYYKGLFNVSLPIFLRENPSPRFAVLRIDANFYDSYQMVLYSLYESVPVGGVIIFDDIMGFPKVMQCWKDFKEDHGILEELVPIDTFGAYVEKIADVKIDQSKMRKSVEH